MTTGKEDVSPSLSPVADVQSGSSATTTDSPVVQKLEGEQLKLALLHQIEFYFSPENLTNDKYLVSLMDEDRFVSLEAIASFGKVSALTTDLTVIVDALSSSKMVELDESKSKIRANLVKPPRCTLALRQLDPSATAEALTALFEAGGFKPTSLRSDIGNFWFAEFGAEDVAMEALLYIRTQKFAGKNILGRIKSETVVSRSYYYPSEPVAQPVYPGFVPMGGWVPTYNIPVYVPKTQGGEAGRARGYGRGKANGAARKDGKKGGQREEDGKRKNSGRKGRGGKEAGSQGAGGRNPAQKPPQLTPAHFPPLPGAAKGSKPGYTGAYKQYSAETIASTLGKAEVEKPGDLPADCPVVLSEPVGTVELAKESAGEAKAEAAEASEKAEETVSASVAEEKEASPDAGVSKPTWSQMVSQSAPAAEAAE